MKNALIIVSLTVVLVVVFSQCGQNENTADVSQGENDSAVVASYGGYESQVKYGEHLVTIGACNDCHTPKKMTPKGPKDDTELLLSGHPANMPAPDVDRAEIERKGLGVTSTLTAWVGPWGISYSANLTSDSTGIGNWTESQFMLALREGKWKGIATNRQLLPPMPWDRYKFMTDDEIKAIFAYLKSTRPIKNVPPAASVPVSAPRS